MYLRVSQVPDKVDKADKVCTCVRRKYPTKYDLTERKLTDKAKSGPPADYELTDKEDKV